MGHGGKNRVGKRTRLRKREAFWKLEPGGGWPSQKGGGVRRGGKGPRTGAKGGIKEGDNDFGKRPGRICDKNEDDG